jgi:hypothetical protein
MSAAIKLAQNKFLMNGGTYELPLEQLREAGKLARDYVFREYPKSLRISHGFEEVTRTTETCKGKEISWTETREIFEDIIVNSEDEEERVLAGGKTSVQIEEQRQGLLMRCAAMGIAADPSWSAVRLRRELGDALDAPAPGDTMAKLEAELANLRKQAAMQAEIDSLKAQLAGSANDGPIEEPGDHKRKKVAP